MQGAGEDPSVAPVVTGARRNKDPAAQRGAEPGGDHRRASPPRGVHQRPDGDAGGGGATVPLGGLCWGKYGDLHYQFHTRTWGRP